MKKELNDKNLKSCSLSSNRAFPKSISKPNDRHGHTDSVGVKTSTLKLKILRSENLNHYLHCGVRIHLLDLHKGYSPQNQNPSWYPIRIWCHFENLKELNFCILHPVKPSKVISNCFLSIQPYSEHIWVNIRSLSLPHCVKYWRYRFLIFRRIPTDRFFRINMVAFSTVIYQGFQTKKFIIWLY